MQESSPSGPNMWPSDKGEWVTAEAYDLKERQLRAAMELLANANNLLREYDEIGRKRHDTKVC